MKVIRVLTPMALAVFVLTFVSPTVLGQSATNVVEWQTIRPTGEEFTVEMPKDYVFESGKMPYHKLEVNTRVYLSTTQNGPTFAVVSLSGIKSNPALYTEMERLNSYVDAYKKFLANRLQGKDAVAQMTLLATKSLNGHSGRVYQMKIGTLSGTAQVFGTRKRFYAITFLNNKKSDSIQDQFLSSFTLPDYVPEAPTAVASQGQKPDPEVQAEITPEEKQKQAQAEAKSDGSVNSTVEGKEATPEPEKEKVAEQSGQKKPVSGGVLNGKAISLPKPDYPPEARAAKASGSVSVQVIIDETGMVISATAISGHPLLQQAAVNAALLARFTPTVLMGEPVKVTGVIMYNFVAQ